MAPARAQRPVAAAQFERREREAAFRLAIRLFKLALADRVAQQPVPVEPGVVIWRAQAIQQQWKLAEALGASGTTGAVKERVQSASETVTNGAQSAGQAIGSAASKAKGPALAGGAAIAGLVGGMTIASRGGRRRVLGLPVPGTRRPLIEVKRPTRVKTTRDLMKAAGHMGNAGRQMAELATEVRLARQEIGNGRRRSPVEVVLDGLTARRQR